MGDYHKLKNKTEEICSLYKDGNFSTVIAKKFNCNVKAVLYHLRKGGVEVRRFTDSHRKYEINESFFDKIDTQEKAYFLGWLYSDGYHNEERRQISLTIQETDKDILEKLNKLIYKDKKVKLIPINLPNHKNQYRILICSQRISKNLKLLGMMQAKSLILKWPKPSQVPDIFIRHFMRGLFDGDGSVHIDKNGYCLTFGLTGSYNICKNFRKIIMEECGLNKVKINTVRNIYTVRFHIKKNVDKVYTFLYKDSVMQLDRKRDRFLCFLNKV